MRKRRVKGRSNGLFVVLEGGDGAGKSTLMRKIESFFKKRSVALIKTREPGGTPLAERIRELILAHSKPGFEIDARTELFLYEAARSHHVAHVIEPALRAGKTVLCDRFTFSSLAYQGIGRGLGLDTVETLNRVATQGRRPDAVILLDISPKKAEERRSKRGMGNRLDSESRSFHRKVRNAFLKIAKKNKDISIVLDATRSPEEIFEQLQKHRIWKGLF